MTKVSLIDSTEATEESSEKELIPFTEASQGLSTSGTASNGNASSGLNSSTASMISSFAPVLTSGANAISSIASGKSALKVAKQTTEQVTIISRNNIQLQELRNSGALALAGANHSAALILATRAQEFEAQQARDKLAFEQKRVEVESKRHDQTMSARADEIAAQREGNTLNYNAATEANLVSLLNNCLASPEAVQKLGGLSALGAFASSGKIPVPARSTPSSTQRMGKF